MLMYFVRLSLNLRLQYTMPLKLPNLKVLAVLLRHNYAYKSPRDLFKIQILIQKTWDKAREFSFLTHSQVMLMLLV